jgi:hypothetical protein
MILTKTWLRTEDGRKDGRRQRDIGVEKGD